MSGSYPAARATATPNGHVRRFTPSSPCPVCGGWDRMRRGQGTRCFGFLSADGEWAHCSREDRAGHAKLHPSSKTYSHKARGECPCGVEHAPALPGTNGNGFAHGGSEIDREYDYLDAAGMLVFQCVRYRNPKTFKQRRPDGRGGWIWNLKGVKPVLYRLPELRAADPSDVVIIAEGEKDVDRLLKEGLIATCNPMGAGKWRDEFSEELRGRRVVILPDNDKAGRDHALQVARSALPLAASVKLVELPGLPERGDVSDFLNVGGTVEELGRLIYQAPDWRPAPEADPAGGGLSEAVGSLKTTYLNAIKASPLRWLVPGYLPKGKLIVVAGEGGTGKSTLTLEMAARISKGEPCLGLSYKADPAEVLLIACEDSFSDTVVPYLTAAGADLSKIRKVDGIVQADGKLSLFGFSQYAALEADLARNPNTALVIVNPAGAYVGRSKVDDHKNSELTSLLEPLADLADKQGATIVLVCHLTKGMGAKAVHRIMGGAGYVNSARAAFILGQDPDDEGRRVLARAKGNCGPVPPARAFRIKTYDPEAQAALLGHDAFAHLDEADRKALVEQLIRVEWDQGAVDLSADDVLGCDGGSGQSATKLEQAADWLEQFLNDGPRESAVIFKQGLKCGHKQSTLYEAKRRRGIKAQASGFQGAWRWGFGDPRDWPEALSQEDLPLSAFGNPPT